MKFLRANPPTFTLEQVSGHLGSHFNLAGSLTPLYSERDQNFRLTDTQHRDWTVKIANAAEDAAVITCQIGTFAHIAKVDPTLPVPRLHPTADGEDMVEIAHDDGQRHQLYLLSFLPGITFDKVARVADLPVRLGHLLARLGRAMAGFDHPGAHDRQLLWDAREVPRYLPEVHRLPSEKDRDLAVGVLEHMRDRVMPRLTGLRHQLIHGDVNEHNALVDPSMSCEITGIIDFGDMIHAPLVQDVASLAADYMNDPASVLEVLSSAVAGYHSVTALQPAEIELIFDLTSARLMLAPLINCYRQEETPDSPNYLSDFTDKHLACGHALQKIGRDAVTRTLRQVCGLPAAETAPRTTSTIAPTVAALLGRRNRALSPSMPLFYDPPLHLVQGDGVWLTDSAGRRYLDCYNNVPHVGHCHPHVAEAIAAQLRRLNTNTRYLGDQAVAYSERLTRSLSPGPGGKSSDNPLSVCAFVNSGSEANDIAWRMARAWTGNAGGMVMEFAYHGITEATDAFSPSATGSGRIAPHIRTLIPPDTYRGAYRGAEQDLAQKFAAHADVQIASLARAGFQPAAFVVDSAFMTNGILDVMPGYLKSVFSKVRAAGGLCIADEVQSGFGRMGKHLWGYSHHDVMPDIITIGKPAGNGHPLGVVITRPEIMEEFCRQSSFFSTFGGNNVSCAAGLAVLDVIEQEHLIENAASTGAHLKQGLTSLMKKHDVIGAVRGTGLAIGVELVVDRQTRAPARYQTGRLLNLLRDEGVLVGSEGQLANIVKVRPPIVFQKEHADLAIQAFDRALSKL
jgi:4-aminobutyrate aminotransferase-like enzyme/Ser/Thr protein kinase RdoA (MazF antagonist)